MVHYAFQASFEVFEGKGTENPRELTAWNPNFQVDGSDVFPFPFAVIRLGSNVSICMRMYGE